jgi:hypothetical protein
MDYESRSAQNLRLSVPSFRLTLDNGSTQDHLVLPMIL